MRKTIKDITPLGIGRGVMTMRRDQKYSEADQPFSGRITFPGDSPAPDSSGVQTINLTAMVIPLDNTPNNTFTTTVQVDGQSINLKLTFRYNEVAQYWVMRIADPATGNILLDSIPLVTGDYPAANLLGQYAYLGLGSAYLVPMGGSPLDYPDNLSLGSYFVLVWGDTDISAISAPISKPPKAPPVTTIFMCAAPLIDETGSSAQDETTSLVLD